MVVVYDCCAYGGNRGGLYSVVLAMRLHSPGAGPVRSGHSSNIIEFCPGGNNSWLVVFYFVFLLFIVGLETDDLFPGI